MCLLCSLLLESTFTTIGVVRYQRVSVCMGVRALLPNTFSKFLFTPNWQQGSELNHLCNAGQVALSFVGVGGGGAGALALAGKVL